MNITLLINRDLPACLALNHLLPRLAGQHRLTVFASDHVGANSERPEPLRLLKFFEQGLFTELLFPLLAEREHHDGLLGFEQLSTYTSRPVTSLNGINTEAGLQTLRASEPDLVISIRYGGILRDEAISVAPQGVINVHSGLLPDYRGVMATFWALHNGATEIGTTTHYIDSSSIDTGPIIGETRLAVVPERSYLWHVLRLYPAACQDLAAIVDRIDRGETVSGRSQSGAGDYYSFPDEAALEQFSARGHRLFDVDEIRDLSLQFTGVTA